MKVDHVRNELYELFARYPRALEIFRKFEMDPAVETLQNLANNFAINRMGYNDHGRTHAYIVARNTLKILNILSEANIQPNIVREGLGDLQDVATVVTVAGFLHDIGNAVHRENHHIHSLILAEPILRKHLQSTKNKYVLLTSILEAIYAHESARAVSIEASIVKVADGMDMEEGRARIPYNMGKFDIHAVSALSIKHVDVVRGSDRPLRIIVNMEHTAGLFQVEKVLGEKIRRSALSEQVEVVIRIPHMGEKVLYF